MSRHQINILAKGLIFIIILSCFPAFVFATGVSRISILVNGYTATFGRFERGVLLAPIQPVADLLGAEIHWNERDQLATITLGNIGVDAAINNPTMTAFNRATREEAPVPLNVAPMFFNGVAYFPVVIIVNILGVSVGVSATWVGVTNTLHIGTQPPENPMKKRNTFDFLIIYKMERNTLMGGITAGFNTSLAPFTSIGLKATFGSTDSYYDNAFFYSISSTAGLVIPVTNATQLFSNFILSAGNFGCWRGIITDNITPGFDVGFTSHRRRPLHGITLKFRGMWYYDVFTHAIGVGVSSRQPVDFFSRPPAGRQPLSPIF